MSTLDPYTYLVKVNEEDGTALQYPVTLMQVRLENPNWSFNDQPDLMLLEQLGYHVVHLTDRPEGDVAIEGMPVFQDDVWQQSWTVRTHTEEEQAAKLAMAIIDTVILIDQRLASALEVGFPFAFGEVTEHVQLRTEDRANISGCALKANRLDKQGITSAILPFRTYENNTYLCTPAEMRTLSDQAYDAFLGFKSVAWQLKDQTKKATTLADIPVIPAMLELPSDWLTQLNPST